MRQLYTASELEKLGLTRSAVRARVQQGRLRKVADRVYAEGPEAPTPIDRARAAAIRSGGVACGAFAGWLLGFDGVVFDGPHLVVAPSGNGHRAGAERRVLPAARVITVAGVPCTNPLQTLVDLAAEIDDNRWELALESALRRRLVAVPDIVDAAAGRQRGARRMRRVMSRRPAGAAPTGSILETLMVQLARRVRDLPPPDRQVIVANANGEFVARVDLAWPALGLFVELDGQHHKDQPVYDARRETAVVAATGWLCGRFTWREVVDLAVITARRLAELADRARRRPLPPTSSAAP